MVSSATMPFESASARPIAARILLAVALCLVAEQWAFAAHVGAGPSAMPGCSMGMTIAMAGPGHVAHPMAGIACIAHCAAQPAVVAQPPTSSAPPRFDVALPAVVAADPAVRRIRWVPDRTTSARAPPHFRTLLYCSLLI